MSNLNRVTVTAPDEALAKTVRELMNQFCAVVTPVNDTRMYGDMTADNMKEFGEAAKTQFPNLLSVDIKPTPEDNNFQDFGSQPPAFETFG